MIGRGILTGMLEQFLDRKLVTQHFSLLFILGMFYVFVAFIVQEIFFPADPVTLPILLALLLVPSLHVLISSEEELERTTSNFWNRHRLILRCYGGAFAGILFGFIFLGFLNVENLALPLNQLLKNHLHPDVINSFIQQPYYADISKFLSLFSHNLQYVLVGFFLALFYGVGSVFLLTYTGYLFAAFVFFLFQKSTSAVQLTGIWFLHMIPESLAYLIAAIAGAILSRALVQEKLGSLQFQNVTWNIVLLLLVSIALLALAAFLETFVVAPVFHAWLLR